MAKFNLLNLFKLKGFTPKQSSKKFDARNADRLKMGLIFVKKGHGVAINNLLFDHGVAMTALLFGEGTREKYVADILGGEESKIEVIIAVFNEKKINEIKEALHTRFVISRDSVGLMIVFDVKSMAGVLAYKYLSDFGGAAKYEGKE
ncbi:MAG: hypothetical protein MJ208_01050 [Bacilli bacterium]|nr:hypothetical protein [Bacilli bacterium]